MAITMAEKARYYAFKALQAEAKATAAEMQLKCLNVILANTPVIHPKAAIINLPTRCDFDTWEARPFDVCPCAYHAEKRAVENLNRKFQVAA